MEKKQQRNKKKISPIQKLFAEAINYENLDKAMLDPEFVAIIKKIRL